MTNSRDSSGGYLTGDESERLWDREEEDAYTAELLGVEDDGSASDLDVRIEAIWTRADDISKEIAEIEETLDRARRTTIFDPTDLLDRVRPARGELPETARRRSGELGEPQGGAHHANDAEHPTCGGGLTLVTMTLWKLMGLNDQKDCDYGLRVANE